MKDRITGEGSLPASWFDVRGRIRARVREAIEEVIEEELEVALGAGRSERCEARRGYRNGVQERLVLTEQGPCELSIPRGRIFEEEGGSGEWHSRLLPRYQRRTRRIDEVILGCYLAGANTRRIRTALAPLLGEELLSKSAISRIVTRLKERFSAWREEDLSGEGCAYLFLDAMRLKVRLARRVVSVPVLAAVGVRQDGQKLLLSLSIAGSESLGSWTAVVEDLGRRGLEDPLLVVLDGNQGLIGSVRQKWPSCQIQRCTKHKLQNLFDQAPKHCHPELKRDYQAILSPDTPDEVSQAYQAFRAKWLRLCPAVVKSLDEAGEHLLTFSRFPKSQWSVLRTTNHIERLHGEFRRRTKTQGSFPNEEAALVLLFGLVAFGQVRLRRIRGHKQMPEVLAQYWSMVA